MGSLGKGFQQALVVIDVCTSRFIYLEIFSYSGSPFFRLLLIFTCLSDKVYLYLLKNQLRHHCKMAIGYITMATLAELPVFATFLPAPRVNPAPFIGLFVCLSPLPLHHLCQYLSGDINVTVTGSTPGSPSRSPPFFLYTWHLFVSHVLS